MAHLRRAGRRLTLPRRRSGGISTQRLDKLIEEATVDCYGDSEQITGFHVMLEEHLDLPFKTKVLGLDVTVEARKLSSREHRRDKGPLDVTSILGSARLPPPPQRRP